MGCLEQYFKTLKNLPGVAEIGQKFFFMQNNPESVFDNNIDPWKRFLAEKATKVAFCKKAT